MLRQQFPRGTSLSEPFPADSATAARLATFAPQSGAQGTAAVGLDLAQRRMADAASGQLTRQFFMVESPRFGPFV